jgi:NAD(P)H dehydrogenase (quinone)
MGPSTAEPSQGLKQNPEVRGIRSIDLYAEKILTQGSDLMKNKKRRDLHKDPEIRDYQEKILWADHHGFYLPHLVGKAPGHPPGLL